MRAIVVDEGVTQFTMSRRAFGRDLYRAACYLVDGLLVDTGIAHEEREFLRALDGRPVNVVLNTHSHEDHIGGNAMLHSTRRVPILAHPRALPVLSDPRRLALRPYQRFLFGTPRPSPAEPVGGTISTGRHEFRVVETPGHSADHIALFEEKRGWLFCGDAYIGGRERVLREDYDVRGMIRTYERLAALNPDTLFTGTGAVVHDPARRIERKITHLLETGERILELRRSGLEERDIARRLLPGDRAIRCVTSGHFASVHLVRSFLSPLPDDRPLTPTRTPPAC